VDERCLSDEHRTPEQILLYNAIKALNLAPKVRIEYFYDIAPEKNGIYVEYKFDGDCLSSLSKALDRLQISYEWKGVDGNYRLNIVANLIKEANFADNLKIYYRQELAKIEKNLFYIKHSRWFKDSIIILGGALFFALMFVILTISLGSLISGIVPAGIAIALLVLSVTGGCLSVKIGKNSDKEILRDFTIEDDLKDVQLLSNLGGEVELDPSYQQLIGQTAVHDKNSSKVPHSLQNSVMRPNSI
jgi:hypothetical protein